MYINFFFIYTLEASCCRAEKHLGGLRGIFVQYREKEMQHLANAREAAFNSYLRAVNDSPADDTVVNDDDCLRRGCS